MSVARFQCVTPCLNFVYRANLHSLRDWRMQAMACLGPFSDSRHKNDSRAVNEIIKDAYTRQPENTILLTNRHGEDSASSMQIRCPKIRAHVSIIASHAPTRTVFNRVGAIPVKRYGVAKLYLT